MRNPPPFEVLVRIPRAMSHLTGGHRLLRVPGNTVAEVLSGLEARYPTLRSVLRDQTGKLRRHILILADSRDIRTQESEETPVSPGSELTILSAIEGG